MFSTKMFKVQIPPLQTIKLSEKWVWWIFLYPGMDCSCHTMAQ